jgi:hypothetical protein
MMTPANSAALENLLRGTNAQLRTLNRRLELLNEHTGKLADQSPIRPDPPDADPVPIFTRHAVASMATAWLLELLAGMATDERGVFAGMPGLRDEVLAKLVVAFDVPDARALGFTAQQGLLHARPGATEDEDTDEDTDVPPDHTPCPICGRPETRREILVPFRFDVIGGIGPATRSDGPICARCAGLLRRPGTEIAIRDSPGLRAVVMPR